MTTLDNSLKNLVEDGPVSFKPGFEFLRKTEQEVNTFIATEFCEKMQQALAIQKDHGHFEPDLAYAIKMYMYMSKTLAGKPCIFWTTTDAGDCVRAAKKMLDDYRLTVDAIEDKDETFKATIAARDEELATTKAELAACKEQIKEKEADSEDLVKHSQDTIGALKFELAEVKNELARVKDEIAREKDKNKAGRRQTAVSPLCDATNV